MRPGARVSDSLEFSAGIRFSEPIFDAGARQPFPNLRSFAGMDFPGYPRDSQTIIHKKIASFHIFILQHRRFRQNVPLRHDRSPDLERRQPESPRADWLQAKAPPGVMAGGGGPRARAVRSTGLRAGRPAAGRSSDRRAVIQRSSDRRIGDRTVDGPFGCWTESPRVDRPSIGGNRIERSSGRVPSGIQAAIGFPRVPDLGGVRVFLGTRAKTPRLGT